MLSNSDRNSMPCFIFITSQEMRCFLSKIFQHQQQDRWYFFEKDQSLENFGSNFALVLKKNDVHIYNSTGCEEVVDIIQ